MTVEEIDWMDASSDFGLLALCRELAALQLVLATQFLVLRRRGHVGVDLGAYAQRA